MSQTGYLPKKYAGHLPKHTRGYTGRLPSALRNDLLLPIISPRLLEAYEPTIYMGYTSLFKHLPLYSMGNHASIYALPGTVHHMARKTGCENSWAYSYYAARMGDEVLAEMTAPLLWKDSADNVTQILMTCFSSNHRHVAAIFLKDANLDYDVVTVAVVRHGGAAMIRVLPRGKNGDVPMRMIRIAINVGNAETLLAIVKHWNLGLEIVSNTIRDRSPTRRLVRAWNQYLRTHNRNDLAVKIRAHGPAYMTVSTN